ncbi:MAG TPA: hypothetical protein PK777_08355, partial [Thermoguttaceae bacterium]|nr:hypothetical protein [Thermoguttaceae bacterium]
MVWADRRLTPNRTSKPSPLRAAPMPTLGLLNEALQLLQECGYTIRQEWLDGTLGGTCILKGQKIFFLDL